MAKLPKMKSIKDDTLWRKFLFSFIMMSLVPILLLLYIVNYVVKPTDAVSQTQISWLIFWIACSAFVGLWMGKSMVRTFITITQRVKKVANGNFSERIEVDEDNEISELAKSFNRITKQLEENIKELERSKKMLQNVLTKVGEAVASFQNIDKFLELILYTTIESVDAKSGKIMLLAERKDELYVKIALGSMRGETGRIKVGEGILGTVAKDGKPLFASTHEEGVKKSAVYIPLIYSGRIIGVLVLSEKISGGEFTEDDLVILSDLSSQISIALENYRLSQDVEKTYIETMNALALAVDARDPYTRGHCKRVADYCAKVAKGIGLSDAVVKLLYDASILHDVGKIGVPDEILRKKTPLTDSERAIINEHPIVGEKILRPIRSLDEVCDFVRHHHEQIDGNGYPDRLSAKDLSAPLNIMIVADAFDAMTSDRPYRKAMSFDEAKQELMRCVGTRFDKQIVDKFIEIV